MNYVYEQRNSDFYSGVLNGLTKLPHIHPHLELIWLEQGSSIATLDGRNALIDEGDLFLAFPNQIHVYHDRSAIHGCMFIFSPELFPDLERLFTQKIPVSPVIPAARLPEQFRQRLWTASEKVRSGRTFDIIAGKGHLLSLLAEVLPEMELIDAPGNPDTIKNILIYCSENFTEQLTLDSLADALHLNRYYISHIFCKRIGMSFPDFLNGLRLERACELLTGGMSITEAAYAAGFSSIRTFNRVFDRGMGMTPTRYIRDETALLGSPSGRAKGESP